MSFIDDVIIRTKGEEGHDKLVEEVVKRLAENDLYMKLEKDKGSRILGSSNRTRGDQNGRREDERGFGLADSERSQKCTEILRIGKLLLSIH